MSVLVIRVVGSQKDLRSLNVIFEKHLVVGGSKSDSSQCLPGGSGLVIDGLGASGGMFFRRGEARQFGDDFFSCVIKLAKGDVDVKQLDISGSFLGRDAPHICVQHNKCWQSVRSSGEGVEVAFHCGSVDTALGTQVVCHWDRDAKV
jgi:hypothetical protein